MNSHSYHTPGLPLFRIDQCIQRRMHNFAKPRPPHRLLLPGHLLFAAAVIWILVLELPSVADAAYKSRYIEKLIYSSTETLYEFNDNLRLPRQLAQMARKKGPVTIEEEVLAKLDMIIEKVEVVLDMFPANLTLTVMLLPDAEGVSNIYLKNYGKRVNHIAYYSLSEDTAHFSADDANIRVVAHEFGHAVVDHFFQVRPPYNIHELMAQFAEKHITD